MLRVLQGHRPFKPLFIFSLALSLLIVIHVLLLRIVAVIQGIQANLNFFFLLGAHVNILVHRVLDLHLVVGLEGGWGGCDLLLALVRLLDGFFLDLKLFLVFNFLFFFLRQDFLLAATDVEHCTRFLNVGDLVVFVDVRVRVLQHKLSH